MAAPDRFVDDRNHARKHIVVRALRNRRVELDIHLGSRRAVRL